MNRNPPFPRPSFPFLPQISSSAPPNPMPNKRKNSKRPPQSPSLSPSTPSSPPLLPPPLPPMDENQEAPKVPPTARKPPPKSKKKPSISKKMLAIAKEKLARLSLNLRPLPFSPTPKTLESVAAHEPLFRSLNLWDFANLPLDDSDLRRDLLAELIAHYDSTKHRSLVRGLRVYLSRADLGRALSLSSAKPHHRSSACASDFDASPFGGADEVASVLSGFISNMMVFLDDDAAILPAEVVTANRLVREGQPNRVDWAGLMWALVEKEIMGALENGNCYYASHLQCLMKYQKPKLFVDMAQEGEPEPSEAATVEEDVDAEEVEDVESEKCGPGLSLGIGGDGEESKKGEETVQVTSDGKDKGLEHCLPESGLMDYTAGAVTSQCEGLSKDESGKGEKVEGSECCLPDFGLNSTAGPSQCNNLSKEEPDKGQQEDLSKEQPDKGDRREGDELRRGGVNEGKSVDNVLDDELAAAKFPSLERLTSSDFMQVMGTGNNLSFGLDQSNGEFLGMGSDMHNKSMGLDMGPGGSFLFGNEHKRPVDEIDDHVNGFNQDRQQKRFRSDQPWENTPTVAGFDGCIEQLQNLMGKARMDLVEKEQAHMNVQVQVQYLNGVLQQKDEIIQALEKNVMLETQKRDIEARRFDHDIKTLSSIVFGCKKALKDTQLAFAEYRKRFPIGNEPLNGEGGGTASDVLGARVLTKPCLTEEEEMRQIARRIINDFYKSCSEKFNNYATSISMYATKLVQLREEIELITKRLAKDKVQNHV